MNVYLLLNLSITDEEKKYHSSPVVELVEYIREFFGWPYKDIASAIGVSPRTLLRFREQESAPRTEARGKLELLAHIADLIDETFPTREGGFAWLNRPKKFLQGQRPIDMLRRGDPIPTFNALVDLYTGVFL